MHKGLLILPLVVAAGVTLAACDSSSMMGSSTASPSPTSDAMMNSPMPSGSPMMESDAMASGQAGVMVGGAAMMPDRDIVANAMNANNLTTLVAAVKAAGLVTTLQGKGPFTVFAPTNAAFNKLPAGTVDTLLKPENKAKLTSILTYHVVSGHYTSADLKDGMKLKTVQGQSLTINNKNGQWWVTDATGASAMIETADVMDSNGVSFVIDSVLMPKM